MNIFVSTGGFPKLAGNIVAERYLRKGIKNIELSGGMHTPTLVEDLLKIKKEANFQVHNYFPPPKNPFVLNLASADQEISNLSLNHIYNSIELCSRLGSKYYSFHAGFLCDLNTAELGKKISKRKLISRDKGTEIFLKKLELISIKAKEHDVNIMVENNVLSKNNLNEFGQNPLLMCDHEETKLIMENSPNNINLLVDVAHLKVSSSSLQFNPEHMFKFCDKFIKGYHLSDNNGLSDTNEVFTPNAWFWKSLNKNLDYYSIEVYGADEERLLKLKKLTEQKIKQN